ncbi:MAG: J domain-containing protein [Clostridiales bacterium]|nr:J domain-containing protein [Clostridiales bacterium]
MMDPYQILGVAPGASDDEVKKAYRQLARKYHPDANPGDKTAEQKMKEVNAAYDMIINKKVGPQGGYGGANQSYYGRSETGGGSQGGYGQGYGEEDPFFGFGFGPFGTFFYGADDQDHYGQNGSSQSGYDPYGTGGYGSAQGGTYRQSYSTSANSPQMQRIAERVQARDYDGALTLLNAVLLKDRNAKWYYYSALANHGVGNRIQARQDAAKAVQMEPGNGEYQMLYARLQNGSYAYNAAGSQYQRPAASLGSFCFTLCLMNFLCRFFPFCWC